MGHEIKREVVDKLCIVHVSLCSKEKVGALVLYLLLVVIHWILRTRFRNLG